MKDIEKFIKACGVKVGPQANKRMLSAGMAALKIKSKAHAGNFRWIIKIAAVVAIIAAVGMVVYVRTGSMDPTGVAFGINDVIKATQKAKWIRLTGNFVLYKSDSDPNGEEGFADIKEVWMCSDPCIVVIKFGSGDADVLDRRRASNYDSASNTINFSKSDGSFSELLINPYTMLSDIVDSAQVEGARIVMSQIVFESKAATMIELHNEDPATITDSNIITDSRSHLIKKMRYSWRSSDGQTTRIDLNFEYPSDGPRNIYEAGAPRNAKVIFDHPRQRLRR